MHILIKLPVNISQNVGVFLYVEFGSILGIFVYFVPHSPCLFLISTIKKSEICQKALRYRICMWHHMAFSSDLVAMSLKALC